MTTSTATIVALRLSGVIIGLGFLRGAYLGLRGREIRVQGLSPARGAVARLFGAIFLLMAMLAFLYAASIGR